MCVRSSEHPAVKVWRELKKAPPKRGKGIPSQGDFNNHSAFVAENIQKVTTRFLNGKIDANKWYEQVDSVLHDGHAGAWALGRQRAGDASARGKDDDLAGRAAADHQDQFLLRFRDDLADPSSGLYDADGNLREGAVRARANLYVGAIRGTANQAFVETGPDDVEYDWKLGGTEQHCEECPQIAALSPYRKDTLFAHPGDGSTPCLGNCDCHLERSDGVTGFKKAGAGDASAVDSSTTDSPGSGPAQGGTQTGGEAPADEADQEDHLGDSFTPAGKAEAALHSTAFDALRSVFQIEKPFDASYDLEISPHTAGAEGYIQPASRLVVINTHTNSPITTLFHEVGHAIDYDVFGSRKAMMSDIVSAGGSGILKDWWNAVTSSVAFRQLLTIESFPGLTIDERHYFRYLLEPAELWARCFAQFVVERQLNPAITAEWEAELAMLKAKGLGVAQWSPHDFAPIAHEIEAILKDKGWMKAISIALERLWKNSAR